MLIKRRLKLKFPLIDTASNDTVDCFKKAKIQGWVGLPIPKEKYE